MDLSTNYSVPTNTGSPAAASTAPSPETGGAAGAGQGLKFDGAAELKGEIVNMSKDSVSIKLPGGDVVSGKMDSFPDAKIGDMVKFTATTGQDGEHTLHVLSKSMTEAKNAMTLNALTAANLKPTQENIKLVNILLESNLPINKESLMSLSNVVKYSGAAELPKALFLLKNNILPTMPAMERLGEYINNNIKLSSQLEQLAKSIMEMPDGAEKQKLLAVLSEALGEAEATAGESPAEKTLQNAGKDGNTTDGLPQKAPNATETAANAQAPTSANLAEQLKTTPLGTEFFRTVFEGAAEAAEHLKNHPLPKEAQQLLEASAGELKEQLGQLSESIKDGSITKEQATDLLKALPGGEKLVAALDTDDKLKSFLLTLAEKDGTLEESTQKATDARELIDRGAKKIAQRLSFSLDGAVSEEKLEKVFDGLKDKLSLIAKTLDGGKDADHIRQNMEDIKDNLKFVDRFKNDPFMQIPLVLNEQQKQAELFVFSGKHGKNKKKLSQSALLSLDLASLGHFETYIRRDDRSIACQFRLADEEISDLVRAHIDKLDALLKEKGYRLDNISFVQTDEKFTLSDNEPNAEEDTLSAEERLGRFSFDSRI